MPARPLTTRSISSAVRPPKPPLGVENGTAIALGPVPPPPPVQLPPPGRLAPVSILPGPVTKSPSTLPPPPLPPFLLPARVPVPSPGPTPVPVPGPKPIEPRVRVSPLRPVNLDRLVARLRSMMLSRTFLFLSSKNWTLGGSGGTSLALGSRARSVSPLPPERPSSPLVAVFLGGSLVGGAESCCCCVLPTVGVGLGSGGSSFSSRVTR